MIAAIAVWWSIFCVLSVNNIQAQTIIDDLQSQTNASDGIIQIECAPSIIALLGKPNNQSGNNSDFVERNGFRILVFMGNDRSEATSKQSAIQSAFPEFSTPLRYEAPNWKLLVGDFLSMEEANTALRRLQKEFPQFGKEMFIVQERFKILIPRY